MEITKFLNDDLFNLIFIVADSGMRAAGNRDFNWDIWTNTSELKGTWYYNKYFNILLSIPSIQSNKLMHSENQRLVKTYHVEQITALLRGFENDPEPYITFATAVNCLLVWAGARPCTLPE